MLGVAVVLLLPLLIPAFGFTFYQYGVLAGMTIYAVPQVLAATVPVSGSSSQIGILVKLLRVLLLGPVIVVFSLTRRTGGSTLPHHGPSRSLVHCGLPWAGHGAQRWALPAPAGRVLPESESMGHYCRHGGSRVGGAAPGRPPCRGHRGGHGATIAAGPDPAEYCADLELQDSLGELCRIVKAKVGKDIATAMCD